MRGEKMKEYQIDNGKFCGYIKIDNTGIIRDSMPAIRKFIGQPLENLISWTNQNFRYCSLKRLNNEKIS